MTTKSSTLVFSVMLVTLLFLSACGETSQPTSSVTQTAPASTSTATPDPTSTLEPTLTTVPTPAPDVIAPCKLPAYAFTNVGFGLPNPSHKLPTIGTVKTIVLFADFSDVPAPQKPEEIFSVISPNAEKFFNDISYRRMTWELEPHFVWLRLSQPSQYYADAIRSYEGHLEFIQEAVTLADADIDFSTADSVVVMVPPQATKIGYGPAFGANPGEGYKADGKVFANGVTSGADLNNWGFLWLNHESGHTMGLPDLYAYVFHNASYDDQHRFVGGFGLMGFISGDAPEYFAFERWQLGWLDDNQINCQIEGEQATTLTAIETQGGTKAVIVPISESKAVVVESRRPLGYDAKLSKSGALVYIVDTSIGSGEGTLVVQPVLDNDPYRYKSPLAAGESVTVDGVTVTVLEATDQGDIVQVTVAK
jgi:M6 family metalloprotease-like protein